MQQYSAEAWEKLWYGCRGPYDAKIVCVGEAFGQEESLSNQAFVGGAGKLLDQMLREASINPDEVLFTNIVAAKPPNNELSTWFLPGRGSLNGLNPGPTIVNGLDELYARLDHYPRKLIIACGNYPLWALTNASRVKKGTIKPKNGAPPEPDFPVGIGDFHGSQLWRMNHWRLNPTEIKIPVLPIFHPAAVLRDYPTRHVTVHDLRMRAKLAIGMTSATAWEPPPRTFLAPPSFDNAVEILQTWIRIAESRELELACDVETKFYRFLTCIGLADSASFAMAIPFVKIVGKGFDSYWKPKEEIYLLQLLSKLCKAKGLRLIGQNFVYDAQWFWHVLRMRPPVGFDTMIMENLLFPGVPKGLGDLSAKYCTHHRYWKDDNREWNETGTLEQHLAYNCEDLVRTFEVASVQREVLTKVDKAKFVQFEMGKFELAREMNENGIRRDPTATLNASQLILSQMQNLAVKLSRLVKQQWVPTNAKVPTPWYRSDSQIKFVLYQLLNLPVQIDRNTKRPSTGKEALNTLKEMFPRLRPLFQSLADYASLDTIYTTFIKAKLEADGKMHCSFNPAGTVTYRWSSSKNAFQRAGNMQNIPVGDSEDSTDEDIIKKPNIRSMFTPEGEDIIVDTDLKGADAQIVAWEAGDEKLKIALKSGVKIHKETAFDFFGEKFLNASGETGNKHSPKGKMYDDIKRATHGTNYGATGKTIATNLGWPLSEGQRFVHWWLKVSHPGIGLWHRRTEESLRTTRGVKNQFGYSIIYYDRIDGLLPEALAWIPQSTVALVSFMGALQLRRKFRFVKMKPWPKFNLQVHDSIVFSIPYSERHHLAEIQDTLNVTVPYPDPLVIGSKLQYSRKSWGELVEFDPKIGYVEP